MRCNSTAGRRRWPSRPASSECCPQACRSTCLLPSTAPAHTDALIYIRRGAASSLVFSPDATRLLVVGGDAVAVLDAATRQQLHRLDVPAVMAAALSPKGTYLITFQRPTKSDGGAGALLAGRGVGRWLGTAAAADACHSPMGEPQLGSSGMHAAFGVEQCSLTPTHATTPCHLSLPACSRPQPEGVAAG